VHGRLHADGRLGPAARLDATGSACTLRDGVVIDGPFAETKEQLLGLYAILAYHVEGLITAMSGEEDEALMSELHQVHGRLHADGRLGPAARLDATGSACTLRDGVVIDGPFAETKEQLLGLYVLDCSSRDEAIAAARDLSRVNPTAVYEIRPIILYLPGVSLAGG